MISLRLEDEGKTGSPPPEILLQTLRFTFQFELEVMPGRLL